MTDKERISQLEVLTAEALRKLDILTGDVSNIKADVSAIRTAQLRTMQVVAGHTEILNEILDVQDKLGQDVADLKTDMAGLKADVSDIRMDMSGLKTDVSEISTDVSGLKTDVSEISTDVSGLKTDVSEISTDVAGMRTDVSNMKSDMTGLRSEMNGRFDALQGMVQALAEQLKSR